MVKLPFLDKNRPNSRDSSEGAEVDGYIERLLLNVDAPKIPGPPESPRWFDTDADAQRNIDNIVDQVANAVRSNAGHDLPALWTSHLLRMIEGYGIVKKENEGMRREMQKEKDAMKQKLKEENDAWKEEIKTWQEEMMMTSQALVQGLKNEIDELKQERECRVQEQQKVKGELRCACGIQQQSIVEIVQMPEQVEVVAGMVMEAAMGNDVDHGEEVPEHLEITVVKTRKVGSEGPAQDKDEEKMPATPESVKERRRVFSFTPGDDNDVFTSTPINHAIIPSRDSFESIISRVGAQSRASIESVVTVIDLSEKTPTSQERQQSSARRGSNSFERSLSRIVAITPIGGHKSKKSTSPLRSLMMRGQVVSADIQVC